MAVPFLRRPGLAVLAAAAAVALVIVVIRFAPVGGGARGQEPAQPKAWVTLVEPRGEALTQPTRFDWNPVAGAAQYKVTIADEDAVWPLVVRTVPAPPLMLTPDEATSMTLGRIHVWDVEALGADGAPIATGGTRFRVAAPGEAR